MFTKSAFKVGVAALASVGFMACSQNGSSNNGDQPATAATATAAGDYTPGTAVHNSKVIGTSETPVGSASTKEEIYSKYPELQKYASELLAVDRVVETNTGDLELYSGANLLIVIGHTATGLEVIHAASGFHAEKITHTMGTADQAQMPSTLSFDLKSCTTPKEVGQDKGQDQGQDKGQMAPAPDKGQDKGQAAPAPDKGQDQGQDKGQVAPMPETCEMINVTLSLSEAQQKQEQGQDKGQDKGQVAPAPDKGQDKGQAAPAPDKGQDKGQAAPAPDKGDDKGQGQDKGQH